MKPSILVFIGEKEIRDNTVKVVWRDNTGEKKEHSSELGELTPLLKDVIDRLEEEVVSLAGRKVRMGVDLGYLI